MARPSSTCRSMPTHPPSWTRSSSSAAVAQKIAEASTEKGFLGFGGVQVSDAEKATIAESRVCSARPKRSGSARLRYLWAMGGRQSYGLTYVGRKPSFSCERVRRQSRRCIIRNFTATSNACREGVLRKGRRLDVLSGVDFEGQDAGMIGGVHWCSRSARHTVDRLARQTLQRM
jgi:hypothetical protein